MGGNVALGCPGVLTPLLAAALGGGQPLWGGGHGGGGGRGVGVRGHAGLGDMTLPLI